MGDESKVMAALPTGHPMLVAFEKYQATDDYKNSFSWAAQAQHREGSMWDAFMAGWCARNDQP